MHHHTDRIAHTTAFVTPVVEHWLEREIAEWVHPMKDRSDDPSHHERTLLPRSHISLPRLGSTKNTRTHHVTYRCITKSYVRRKQIYCWSLVSARVDFDPPASIYFIVSNFSRSRNITARHQIFVGISLIFKINGINLPLVFIIYKKTYWSQLDSLMVSLKQY